MLIDKNQCFIIIVFNMNVLGFKMDRAKTPNVDLPSFAIETSKKLFQTFLL